MTYHCYILVWWAFSTLFWCVWKNEQPEKRFHKVDSALRNGDGAVNVYQSIPDPETNLQQQDYTLSELGQSKMFPKVGTMSYNPFCTLIFRSSIIDNKLQFTRGLIGGRHGENEQY
jgi:hypothetical protein